MKKRLLQLLFLMLLFCLSAYGGDDARRRKMCWAHYVGWGFNQRDGYDLAALSPRWMLGPFNDRTLLGRDLQWDSGIFFGARKQIDAARAYGIDGFCIDIVDPAGFTSGLGRFFRDAEGTSFKVALCMDNLNYPGDYLLRHLGNFIKTYKDHPNACRIDGKMVIFVYNLRGKSTAEWLAIRKELAKRGLDAYYVSQMSPEWLAHVDPDELSGKLEASEGFYDFGCNGFSLEQMKARLAAGRAALQKKRPDGILCPGIAVGYLGSSSGFYRPYLNSETLRNNWEAALANKADWVCLTTWNDYIENTQFEPSVINRDALLLINREYLNRWRGIESPARPPRVIYSYHEETVFGDDLTIEVLSFSYTTPASRARVRLLDGAGKTLHEFPEISLKKDALDVKTMRLTHEELRDWEVIRVQAAVYAAGEKPEFRELYPIVRRPGRIESLRTIRLRQDDITPVAASLELKEKDGRRVAYGRINSWMYAGKYELLRNGWPVAEGEINHLKKPVYEVAIPLPEPARSPADVYCLRLTDVAERIGFSNPVVDKRPGFDGKSRQPVIVTGSDFDENWPVWEHRISRLPNGKVQNMEVPERSIFRVRYDFKEGEGKLLTSSSGWTVPALLGCANGLVFWGEKPEFTPTWKTAAGPDGTMRKLLAFDGRQNNIAVASRTMPYGPFTLELLLRPERKGAPMALFQDRCGIELSLDEALRPRIRRDGSPELTGSKALPEQRWSHLAAVYTGRKLLLYLDGKKIGEGEAQSRTFSVNSVPRIGNTLDLNRGYLGEMGGFLLEGAVRAPQEFQLLPAKK